MEIFNLPYDIFPGRDVTAEDIIIHDYSVREGSMKGRSILHTNAISLVLQGHKTMHFAEKTVSANESEIHLLSAGNCRWRAIVITGNEIAEIQRADAIPAG